jgi:hypothetical protein
MHDERDEPTPGDSGDEIGWLDLCAVYRAPDEPSAIHVTAMLRSVGIVARVRSAQIPAFDGAFAMAVGFWGEVMVPREDFLNARTLVEAFVRDAEGGGPEVPWLPSEMQGTKGTESAPQ